MARISSSSDQACAGMSFLHCYGDMERAQERYRVGQQLAICDDGDGPGSVVALAMDEDPEDACLHAGAPGPLLRVIDCQRRYRRADFRPRCLAREPQRRSAPVGPPKRARAGGGSVIAWRWTLSCVAKFDQLGTGT